MAYLMLRVFLAKCYVIVIIIFEILVNEMEGHQHLTGSGFFCGNRYCFIFTTQMINVNQIKSGHT